MTHKARLEFCRQGMEEAKKEDPEAASVEDKKFFEFQKAQL